MAATRHDAHHEPDIDRSDLIHPDDMDVDIDDDIDDSTNANTSARQPLTGNITTNSSTRPLNSNYLTSTIPGEDRRAGTNTIDEPVWATLRRDLLAVWGKLREVLWPKYMLGGSMFDEAAQRRAGGAGGDEESRAGAAGIGSGLRGAYENLRGAGLSGARDELVGLAGRAVDADALLDGNNMTQGLRDWDLWGPLIFCLLLSVLLSFNARVEQRDVVFSGVFAIVWIGEAAVTTQIKLLGGNISFAQSVCIIGYTLFPLVIAAMLSALRIPIIARVPVYLFLICWALASGVSILSGSGVVKNRVALAVFPLFIFYMGLGCLCFVS